ncbi:MAG: hypothetical protein R3A10_07195 [Caldilineaceae bacterium]
MGCGEGIAALGVLYLTVTYGALPWIALTLAFSFGFYGVLKKRARLAALEGMAVEMAILSTGGLLYLFWLTANGTAALTTATPAYRGAARRHRCGDALPLPGVRRSSGGCRSRSSASSSILPPPPIHLLGVLLYQEAFPPSRLVGFVLIWLALVVFSTDGVLTAQAVARAVCVKRDA